MNEAELGRLIGLPVIYNRWVPEGKLYILGGHTVIIGTWTPPIRQSVSAIIAMQRRRRSR